MREIVCKFLENQYRFTLNTISTYYLQDRHTKEYISLNNIFKDIKVIFDIDNVVLDNIWTYWANKKIIELNNRITDIRYKLFEKYGYDVNLGINDINDALSNDELEEILRMNE